MFSILFIILTNIDLTDSQRNISHGRNILLGKPISICSFTAAIPRLILTDGDRLEARKFNCHYYSTHTFSSREYLKYMIIFTGERGRFRGKEHSLDNLEVHCYYRKSYGCARISAPIRMLKNLENGVHLSFMNELTTSISLDVQDVILSEIDLYTRDNVTHRGCFTNVTGNISFTYDGFVKCQKNCEQSIFGISTPLSSCLCIDEIDFESEVSLSECDETCDDSNNKCGGNNSYSVYIQEYHIPAFSGCPFKDAPLAKVKQSGGEVRLEIPIIDLTFSKCVRHCGLGISLFWNGSCGCATSGYGLIESDLVNITHIVFHKSRSCDIPCEFDKENACGGVYGISVYRNCATNNPILCDKLLNCKRAIFDHHGVCTHGCKSGFEGKHCILKVSDPIPEEFEEPDEELELTSTSIMVMTSTETEESTVETTIVQSKSVNMMADYIFSIWVATTFFKILF